ncbi:unnamed protein product [Cladocopium goreaui]|uniref:Tubulin--tyrosine ligase-like protein 5 n=1 Tax=Cladocopium goreaui TaxID=2562237 RepID=A0A9P1G0R8_9DINO|nr:unnamed protein product [Cladocopium goreaui]
MLLKYSASPLLVKAQPDLLNSLPQGSRDELLQHIHELLEGARRQKWLVIFTGLRFKSGYAGVPRRHRVFGGLQRMNAAQGDERVHWFMEGFQGAEIVRDLAPQEGETVLWRQRMRHDSSLVDTLKAKNVTKVALAGLKTGQGLLAAAELLADEGLLLYVARECVADDKVERGEAVLQHVLPHLADVLSFEDLRTQLAHEIMMDMFVEFKTVKRAG